MKLKLKVKLDLTSGPGGWDGVETYQETLQKPSEFVIHLTPCVFQLCLTQLEFDTGNPVS